MKCTIRVVPVLGILTILSLIGCAKTTAPPTNSQTNTVTPTPTTTASPTPTTTTPAQYGDLRVALGTIGNENMDPALANTTTIGNYLIPMLDSLFWNETPEVLPGIVEKWTMADDGLSWTYNLRKGVKFHNGADLTAADVKFSLDRYLSKDAFSANLRNAVTRTEIVDDYTIRIYTQGVQPFLPNMSNLTNPMQGLVLPKSYIETNGMEFFARHPVGSGPWKFARRVPGDNIQFEAQAHHWRQTPAFKTLTVILVPEETTRVAMLKTGAVDDIEIGIESAEGLDSAGFKTFVVDITQPNVMLHGAFDPRALSAKMPITDIRVRQALSLAINRDEIRASFFRGKAGPPTPPFVPESSIDVDLNYWKDYVSKIYVYDPAKAVQLLKDAGYPNGFSQTLTTYSPSGAAYVPKLAEVVQSYWAKIGVKTEIVLIDQGTYTTIRSTEKSPVMVGQISLSRYPNLSFTPQNLTSGFDSAGAHTMVGKGIPQLDTLIRAIYTEPNTAKRKDMTTQAIKLATDAMTVEPICSAPSLGALSPKVDLTFPSPMPSPYMVMYADKAKHK